MNNIVTYLNEILKDAKCELEYNNNYEFLIVIMLSAQTTDKMVNKVSKNLFSKYDTLYKLSVAKKEDIINIIKPLGNFNKKSDYIINIAQKLLIHGDDLNNRTFLESLDGVGRKTANVFLSNVYNVPCIAVDTHVKRVCTRLGISKEKDDVLKVEQKIYRKFDKDILCLLHHQLVLFGRYYCKAKNPSCENCKLKEQCKYYKNK